MLAKSRGRPAAARQWPWGCSCALPAPARAHNNAPPGAAAAGVAAAAAAAPALPPDLSELLLGMLTMADRKQLRLVSKAACAQFDEEFTASATEIEFNCEAQLAALAASGPGALRRFASLESVSVQPNEHLMWCADSGPPCDGAVVAAALRALGAAPGGGCRTGPSLTLGFGDLLEQAPPRACCSAATDFGLVSV